jgi:hypothetical protein
VSESGEWEFVEYRADGSYLTPPDQSATCAECHIKAGAERDFGYHGRFGDPGKHSPPLSALHFLWLNIVGAGFSNSQ